MSPEQQEQLRAKFKPAQIGKLPKPTKKDNPKGHCDFCGGYHGLPAMHLDYVGHAAVTERILSVDPDYEFGPVLDVNKRPIKSEDGSVLYYLTIADSTKYEWGDGPNMKEISSDAIRRCAMRFGVALDLWAKEPLTGEQDAEAPAPKPAARAKRSGPRSRSLAGPGWSGVTSGPPASHIALFEACKNAGVDDDLRHRITLMLMSGTTQSVKDLDDEQVDKIAAQIRLFGENKAAGMKVLEQWEAS